jgi:hypothetical protein
MPKIAQWEVQEGMKRFKWVQQEDDAGCGIACCAMVTGKSYLQVKDELRNVYHGGLETKHLDDYLFEQGYFIRRQYKWNRVTQVVREWPIYPALLCIACVVANSESDSFHFVVVHNGIVYDPATVSIKSLDEYVRVEWLAGLTTPKRQRAK